MKNLQTSRQESDTIIVSRATANIPQSTASPIFTVTGGRVCITHLSGTVTTVIQAQANNMKLIANPTVGADEDICAVLDINADAVGFGYTITGVLTDAMVSYESGAYENQASGLVVTTGTVDLSCSASSTGQVSWVIHYHPIDPGARLVSA